MTPEEERLRQLWREYATAFSTEAGRRVLEDLEATHFYHRSTAVFDAHDQTVFNEGSRYVVLRIHQMIRQASEPTPQPYVEEDGTDG